MCGVHPPILGQPTIQGGIKIFCGYLAGTMGLASIKKQLSLTSNIRKTGTFIQKTDAEILFHLLGNHFISKAEEAKHE